MNKSPSTRTTDRCDEVAERIAGGDELGELAAHVATCARCTRLVALPVALATTGHAADPGIGFASRMTAGAQHRLVVRRRQRIAIGGGLAVAAAAAIALLVLQPAAVAPVAGLPPKLPSPVMPHEPAGIDPDVRALVHLANIERSSHLGARWRRLEASLAPYRAVLKGTQP